MAYVINKTDGSIVATVEDGALNSDTSLQLIGRNYQSYGEPFNENLVKLLENSASTSAPTTPLTLHHSQLVLMNLVHFGITQQQINCTCMMAQIGIL